MHKIISIILLSCSLFVFATAGAQKPATQVSVAEAKAMRWVPSIMQTGTLIAENGITVKTEVDGRIDEILIKSGQEVKKGDLLFQLNADVESSRLKQYEVDMKLKEMDLERAKDLRDKKAVSQSGYDQAVSDFQSAQAKVAQSKAELDQLSVNAPFDGKLGLRQVSVGDYVTSGDPLINLQSIDPILVDFNVPETYLGQMRVVEAVEVTSSAYPDLKVQGKIKAVESLIDPNTRTLKARAELPNKDAKLIPGSFVQVKLLLGNAQDVIVVPQTAVFTDKGKDAVYLVKDNKAVLTSVNVLKRQNNDMLISSSSINAGDQVVTAGQIKLQDQSPVTPIKD